MGKIAFVFSGQGAQYSGMGRELFESSEAARKLFQMADSIRPGTSKQCFEGTAEELSLTINTQPCLYCVDLAAALALKEKGVVPSAVAGFSLGEIAALAFAGAYSYEDGFRIVCERARLMNDAAGKVSGGMAAVLKLTEDEVKALCDKAGVFAVNFNCPGQTVVAGEKEAISKFIETAKEHGGRVVPLAVSGAFHTPYMQEASNGLAEMLSGFDISAPELPVYSNTDAQEYGKEVAQTLAKQASSPVLWSRTVENMAGSGIDTFIEAGPGKTLSGLIKKCRADVKVLNVQDQQSLDDTIISLKEDGLC